MHYTVARNGVPLAAVSPLIRIVDVIEVTPDRSIQAAPRGGSLGSFITKDQRKSLAIRIQFVILTNDYTQRTAILAQTAAWARSGMWLTIADRPGQRLWCICTGFPATQSKRKWAGLCEMTFTAYRVPLWEIVEPVRAEATTADALHTLHITPSGTYPAPLLGTIAAAGAVTHITLAANGQKMAFSGLALNNGGQVDITLENGLEGAFCAASAGAARLPCLHLRTADSADMLTLPPGQLSEITVTADGPVTVSLEARGYVD